MAGFARRDENSSIGATYTRRKPEGPGQTNSLHARTGYFAGKTRGVGRHLTRDENSSPGAKRVQPRTLDGRYASHVPHENDVKVIHPKGRFSTQPKTSALGIHRKGRGAETRGHVEKALPMRAGAARSLSAALAPKGVTGVARNSLAESSRVAAARSGAAKPFGRSNTRFGMSGSRGRRLAS